MEKSVKSSDGMVISFPLAIIPITSSLYLLLSGATKVGIQKDSEGNILVEFPGSSLAILRKYLLSGDVEEGNLEVLVTQLDY